MATLYSTEEMIQRLQAYYQENGLIPRYKTQTTGISSAAYIRRFKTWENTLKVAGFDIEQIILTRTCPQCTLEFKTNKLCRHC